MYSTHKPSAAHLMRLHQIAPEFSVVHAQDEAQARAAAPIAQIILGHRYLSQVVGETTHLKWVQSTAGGVDHLPLSLLHANHVLLSRCTTSSDAIAKHAYNLYLQLETPVLPQARRAMILGFGSIGKRIAKIARQNEMIILGVCRHQNESAKKLCDRLFFDHSWEDALSAVDVCFVCLPLLKGNKNVLNQDLINNFGKNTIIVNVGRPQTIDEEYLVRRLKNGKLAGYATDVAGLHLSKIKNELTHLNLIVTPHVAAHYKDREIELEGYIEKQLVSYLSGSPLENLISYDEYQI